MLTLCLAWLLLCRIRLLSCCWDLHRLSATSASLWADISVRLGSPSRSHQFVRVLSRSGVALRLRQLRIDHHHEPAAFVFWSNSSINKLVTVLARVDSLELLDWTIPLGVTPRLDVWAGWLPHLRSLSLTSQAAQLELPACLGRGLPSLQELCIYADVGSEGSAKLVLGCLPPSLQRLELYDPSMWFLPRAMEEATQLMELCLWTNNQSMSLEGVEQLVSLRRLALRDIPTNLETFDYLAELPLLDSLELSGQPRGRSSSHASLFDGITQLRTLREPCLGGWGLHQLPEDLLAMPNLEVRKASEPYTSQPCLGVACMVLPCLAG